MCCSKRSPLEKQGFCHLPLVIPIVQFRTRGTLTSIIAKSSQLRFLTVTPPFARGQIDLERESLRRTILSTCVKRTSGRGQRLLKAHYTTMLTYPGGSFPELLKSFEHAAEGLSNTHDRSNNVRTLTHGNSTHYTPNQIAVPPMSPCYSNSCAPEPS